MAARKTERLLNLVLCLLSTRRFLTVQEIREAVPGYDPANEEAFRRMFERDKEELRELGVPLETGANHHDGDQGYRIARRDYELPELHLEPDEAAVLGLAARLWQSAPLAAASDSAMLKLRAAGIEAPPAAPLLETRVTPVEPAFEACWAAVRDGHPIGFGYRTRGHGDPEQRDVEPWGVVLWHGRWYLVGHDRVRDAERVFRLSRILGEVERTGPDGTVTAPEGLDLRGTVARLAGSFRRGTATVRVRPGAGHELRRQATSTGPAADGWDVLEIGYGDPDQLAQRLAGFGAAVVVDGPAEVRDAVVRLLSALAS